MFLWPLFGYFCFLNQWDKEDGKCSWKNNKLAFPEQAFDFQEQALFFFSFLKYVLNCSLSSELSLLISTRNSLSLSFFFLFFYHNRLNTISHGGRIWVSDKDLSWVELQIILRSSSALLWVPSRITKPGFVLLRLASFQLQTCACWVFVNQITEEVKHTKPLCCHLNPDFFYSLPERH